MIILLTFYFPSRGQVPGTTKNLSSESVQIEEFRRMSDISAIINILNIQSQTIENINQMIELLNNKYEISETKIDTILISLNIEYSTPNPPQKNNLTKQELLNAETYFSIEKALQSPMSVFKLDLSKNALTEFPDKIKQFKNLQKLILSDNLLKVIPDWIKQLESLQYIYLDSNLFERFPESLIDVKSLILIDLTCNPIRYVTYEITKCTNLKVLNLHDSKINYKELQRLKRSMGEIIIK
jgi:Leucine-rich repeat (LRR) protein